METIQTWEFINSFAPWLAAIGTLAAVIVSLYLALTPRPIMLKISAGHRLVVTPGQNSRPEFLVISATNIGHRAAIIESIGWKAGFIRKKYAIQIPFDNIYSHNLPTTINDGQSAKWLFPLDDTDWLDNFVKDFLLPHSRWNVLFVRAQLFTSIGKTFEARLDKGMRKKLLEVSKKLSQG